MSGKNTKSFKERALGEPGSKKKVNSKVKGNRNEVEVAKALSKWTGVTFRRTPASGAIHVPLDWLSGDVFCTSKSFDFPFTVEAKHYKKITDGQLMTFFLQAKTDADRVKRHPLLLARENEMPKGEWYAVLDIACMFFAKKGFRPDVFLIGELSPFRIKSTDLFSVDYNELAKHLKRW